MLKLIKRKASSKHLVEHGGANEHTAATKKTSKGAKSQPQSSSAASKAATDSTNNDHHHLLTNTYGDNLLRLDSNTSVNSWASLDFQSGGLLDGAGSSSLNNNNSSYLLDQGGSG